VDAKQDLVLIDTNLSFKLRISTPYDKIQGSPMVRVPQDLLQELLQVQRGTCAC